VVVDADVGVEPVIGDGGVQEGVVDVDTLQPYSLRASLINRSAGIRKSPRRSTCVVDQ